MVLLSCWPRRILRMPRDRLAAILIAALAAISAGPASAETLSGVAVIDTGMAAPSGSTFEAVIEDVSRADAPAQVIAGTVIGTPGGPSIAFAIDYDPADLQPGAIYALRATIRQSGDLIFTTDTFTRVLRDGAAEPVEVRLRPVGQKTGTPTHPLGAHRLCLPASFTGVLPCADCEGVQHHLDLWPDQVYQLRRDWLGRAEGPMRRDEIGRWYADPARGAIVLYGASEMPLFWQIKAPDRLRQMDREGNPVDSELPYDLTSNGVLRPTDLDALFLSGEVLVGADGPALRECLTGRVYPVGEDAAYPELAAAVEAKRPGAGSPLLVSLEARITHPAPGLAPQSRS